MIPAGDDFVYGVAASSYQIEGALDADGRGPDVWDMFCRQPGRVREGHDASIACAHYDRWAGDVALIADLGVDAYRLSISWPRVLPEGVGRVEPRGLDFYERVVDALLERGVQPWVTLFHWDYPLALFHRGGWLNRDSARWFGDYADHVAARLGDRVKHWMTLNEPQCFLGLGHSMGRHAPGLRLGAAEVLRATHHALMAHGDATRAVRARSPGARVGWAPVAWITYPARDEEALVAEARRRTFGFDPQLEAWTFNNVWYADAVLRGSYPEEAWRRLGALVPDVRPGDMERMSPAIDFYGMNYYHGSPVHEASDAPVLLPRRPRGHAETMMGWSVDEDGLRWGMRFLHERYGLPLVVTENGIANMDWVHADGSVSDPQRVDYLRRHLGAVARARAEGVPVEGYFHWSILDNFEWELGYSRRFGLVYVDFETQRRTPKASYHAYRELLRAR